MALCTTRVRPSKNSQQDLDKNLAWISARSCMISQEFGTPCYILLDLDKILSRFLWDFASCKISQDFGTYPTKLCNILLRSCGVFLQGRAVHQAFSHLSTTPIFGHTHKKKVWARDYTVCMSNLVKLQLQYMHLCNLWAQPLNVLYLDRFGLVRNHY